MLRRAWCFLPGSITVPLLQRLHWLKMEQRIDLKLALLAYRCLHGLAPGSTIPRQRIAAFSTLDTRRRLRSVWKAAVDVPRNLQRVVFVYSAL